MNPIQALEILNHLVKSAKLPYTDHVVLERCVDVLLQILQQQAPDATAPSIVEEPIQNVAFDEPTADSGFCNAETVCEEKPKRQRRTKKGTCN